MIAKTMNPRAAYAGELLLTSERTESMDSWATGLNNNVLVLGCSGAGKTRNFLKPNLLQCHGSYVVLDSKGRLFHEMAPYLSDHGYTVDCLDFTTMGGRSVTIRFIMCAGGGAVRLHRTSLALRARSFPATRWVTTRFGRARLPITLQATSPTFLRHCPIVNGTWPRW